jgi:hypothetical protein
MNQKYTDLKEEISKLRITIKYLMNDLQFLKVNVIGGMDCYDKCNI